MDRIAPFGVLLRRQRRVCGLTQEALALAAFCSLDTIKKLEHGRRRPSLQMAIQLAEVLGLANDVRALFLAAAVEDTDNRYTQQRDPNSIIISPHPLPRQTTPLVGRTRERDQVCSRLCDPDTRLVTLIAPGGMGKTRLALSAAAHLQAERSFPDGVAFAALAPLIDPAGIEPTIMEALGQSLETVGGRSPRLQLLALLRAKTLLLVLDNCEHLLEAVADLAHAILVEAPGVTLLATSRERLHLRAEYVVPLAGMDVESDGIRLFAAVAGAVQPSFAITEITRPQVAAICTHLGGMPLAIELAAGWADTLSLAEIAADLAQSDALLTSQALDLASRHRRLREVWDSTWARLTPEEQTTLAQFSVFRGGGTRQALEAVTGAHPVLLQALVGKALLRYDADRSRYVMHELLRQYAGEHVWNGSTFVQGVYERHAGYYLAWVAAHDHALKGANQQATLRVIESDLQNVHAAWEWVIGAGDITRLSEAIGSLAIVYEWLGRTDEGWALCAQAVGAAPASTMVRARLLAAQARFAFLQGNQQAALALVRQAQADLHPDGVSAEKADVLLQLGHCLANQDFVAASEAYQASLALFEALDNRWGAATTCFGLGRAMVNLRSDYAGGRRYLQQSAAGYHALGDAIGECEALAMLSMTSRYMNGARESLSLALQAYAVAEASGTPRLLAHAGSNLGAALFTCNEPAEAEVVLRDALTLMLKLGHQVELPSVYVRLGNAIARLGRYPEARTTYQLGLALAERAGDDVATTALLTGLAEVALAEQSAEEALRLSETVIRRSETLGERYFHLSALRLAALAARRLGRFAQARALAVTGLRQWLKTPAVVWNLWPEALLLVDEAHHEYAVGVFLLGERAHPGEAHALGEDIGLREIQAVVQSLSPIARAKAELRWAERDTPQAVHLLLTELVAKGWEANQ